MVPELQKIIDELDACADASAVAELLRQKGVKGSPHDPVCCPIANLINPICHCWVMPGDDKYIEFIGGDRVPLPAAADRFALDFDQGSYADLSDLK